MYIVRKEYIQLKSLSFKKLVFTFLFISVYFINYKILFSFAHFNCFNFMSFYLIINYAEIFCVLFLRIILIIFILCYNFYCLLIIYLLFFALLLLFFIYCPHYDIYNYKLFNFQLKLNFTFNLFTFVSHIPFYLILQFPITRFPFILCVCV